MLQPLETTPSYSPRPAAHPVKFSDMCSFFDAQWKATEIADAHKYTLYGGSRGPGKSHWLRWYLVRFLLECGAKGLKRVRVGLFCEDYPALKDRHLSKIAAEFPYWLGELKDYTTEGLAYMLKPAYGSGMIALRNLDDPSKYKSSEFALIGVDELTQNKPKVFDTLRGSLRWPGIEEPKFIAASNPDGPGQMWVRKYWVEREFPEEMATQADKFAYLPALPGDNPFLPASYWDELNSLPEPLRSAWRDGNWYTMMVGLVYSDFGAGNIEAREVDPERPFELACDDGYVDPRAILFIQRTGTEIYVFDELYHSKHLAEVCVEEVINKSVEHFGYKDQSGELISATDAQKLSQAERDKLRPAKIPEIAIGSPEAKELQGRFRLADIPYRYKPHKIVEGIQVVRRLIKDGNGYRALKVHPRCRNFISELTQGYRYPEEGSRGSDEVPIDDSNHACLIAGTLIETINGSLPIEKIQPDDFVLTRDGYRKVIESGRTAKSASVMTAKFSDGRVLIGTPNHLVYVIGSNYIPMLALRYGDIVEVLTQEVPRWKNASLLNITGSSIIATQSQVSGLTRCTINREGIMSNLVMSLPYIVKYGVMHTGRFQTIATFITKMATPVTIFLIILSALWEKNISKIMGARFQKRSASEGLKGLNLQGQLRLHGINQMLGENGIRHLGNSLGLILNRLLWFVITATRNLKQSRSMAIPVFAPITANLGGGIITPSMGRNVFVGDVGRPSRSKVSMKSSGIAPVSVVCVTENANPESVYNLQVDNAVGKGEYFANGVLVHNCDSLRYWTWIRARK